MSKQDRSQWVSVSKRKGERDAPRLDNVKQHRVCDPIPHLKRVCLLELLDPERVEVLYRVRVSCTLAALFDQPPLYQQTQKEPVGAAFHISIGWTLGAPDEETCLAALKLFRDEAFEDIHTWNVKVDGIKAKIGNVVVHIPLMSNLKTKDDDDDGFASSLYGS